MINLFLEIAPSAFYVCFDNEKDLATAILNTMSWNLVGAIVGGG